MRLMRRRVAISGIATAAALLGPVAATGQAAKFKRLFTANGSSAQAVAMARTPNGSLHLVFQTFAGRTFSGLAALSISASGSPGPVIQALAGWQVGQPGLVALPGGTLEAVFGATAPSSSLSSVWGITSTNGGATWSAPADVKGGGPNEGLAYGSDVTAVMSPGGPILSLPQAGNVVIQRGLGPGSPNYLLTNASNGSATDADLAVDAATGQVVAGWYSIAGAPRDYLQAASPTVGPAQAVPGLSRNALIPAGRDKGAGVYAAYTPDGTHVRLLRYGGGSVAVGRDKGTTAKALGAATGPNGRIWVMWGDDSGGGVVVTRSNKAVTRFEPLQTLTLNAFTLYRVSGDGRLGPLDLLVDQIPNSKGSVQPAGEFYARVLPVLSAKASVTQLKNGKFTVTVTITDAGDAVSGATLSRQGQSKKTNNKGVAKLMVSGTRSGFATFTITAPGYQMLKTTVKL